VVLLLDAGCRINEALTIRVRHVDLDNLLLTLDGKGSTQRIVPLSFELRKVMFRCIADFSRRPDHLLLATRNETQLGRRVVLRWVFARRFWDAWKQFLVLVQPETVVRWHRAGFRTYWRLISRVRKQVGRKPIAREVRDLIFRMMAENATWGAPRIHGELRMLGFDVSERTISRWMKRVPRDPRPAQRWRAFLANHREAIAAMDFFTVPTITFGVLYGFFVIGHERRRILHFNVTRHPTSTWIVQQLREAFPHESAPRFLLFDHDQKYGLEVPAAVRSLQITGSQTSFASPWQNGVAERWVGSCRRELLDHGIARNERHLKRLFPRTFPTIMKTARTLGWGRERREAELAGEPRVACFPRIDSVGCTTVMIGRPSPKTFPSLLNMCVRPADV
jgi:transposase InsO family protein